MREYGNNLDFELMKKRAVNAVGSFAVYMRQSSGGSFVEDITDMFSFINDNDKHDGCENEVLSKFMLISDDGEVVNEINSKVLKDYGEKKAIKEKRLKNRFKVKLPEEERREKLEFARFEYNLRQEDKNGGCNNA